MKRDDYSNQTLTELEEQIIFGKDLTESAEKWESIFDEPENYSEVKNEGVEFAEGDPSIFDGCPDEYSPQKNKAETPRVGLKDDYNEELNDLNPVKIAAATQKDLMNTIQRRGRLQQLAGLNTEEMYGPEEIIEEAVKETTKAVENYKTLGMNQSAGREKYSDFENSEYFGELSDMDFDKAEKRTLH